MLNGECIPAGSVEGNSDGKDDDEEMLVPLASQDSNTWGHGCVTSLFLIFWHE